MKRFLLAAALLSSLSLSAQTSASNESFAFTHVTVIDCTGGPVKEDMTVLISGSKIAAISASKDAVLPKNVRTIEATAKFLIPGLWDMHGHLTDAGPHAPALLIENGVTGVRDMGGDLELVRSLRREIASGKRLGPRIVAAGPFLDGQDQAKWHLKATNGVEARELVRSIKQRGADFVKIHNALPREAFFAAMDEAHKQGIQVAVHLPQTVTIAEASNAGAVSLEHVEMLVQSALLQQDAAMKSRDEKTRFDAALASVTGDNGNALWAVLKNNGTYYVPTLVAYERGFVLWSNKASALWPRRSVHWRQIDVVAGMHRAGVKILAGTDFSDWALVPGIDLHNELALLVEAGFSPLEALQSATSLPAEFLGKQDSMGTIEKGKIADLVLLDANPLEDISHTRKINSVVLGGRLIPVESLREDLLQPGSK